MYYQDNIKWIISIILNGLSIYYQGDYQFHIKGITSKILGGLPVKY